MANIRLDVVVGQGWNSIQENIRKTSELSENLFSSISGITDAFKGMALDLIKISGLGVLSLSGLAALSPRLKAYLDMLEASLFKIRDEVAKGLEPTFKLLNETLQGVADWVSKHPELWEALGSVLSKVIEGASVLVGILGNIYDSLLNIAKTWGIVVEMDGKLKLDDKLQYIWDTFGSSIGAGMIVYAITKNPTLAFGAAGTTYVAEQATNLAQGKNISGFELLLALAGGVGAFGMASTVLLPMLGLGAVGSAIALTLSTLLGGGIGYGVGSILQGITNLLIPKEQKTSTTTNKNVVSNVDINVNITDNNTRIASYTIQTG
ncbi:MAG: hypothetical protein QXL51_01020 [Candidatus Aenigmatarchaeota archaeon]